MLFFTFHPSIPDHSHHPPHKQTFLFIMRLLYFHSVYRLKINVGHKKNLSKKFSSFHRHYHQSVLIVPFTADPENVPSHGRAMIFHSRLTLVPSSPNSSAKYQVKIMFMTFSKLSLYFSLSAINHKSNSAAALAYALLTNVSTTLTSHSSRRSAVGSLEQIIEKTLIHFDYFPFLGPATFFSARGMRKKNIQRTYQSENGIKRKNRRFSLSARSSTSISIKLTR